jgi:hypothetical protein
VHCGRDLGCGSVSSLTEVLWPSLCRLSASTRALCLFFFLPRWLFLLFFRLCFFSNCLYLTLYLVSF